MIEGREQTDRSAAIRNGIIETARSLGIDPVDLATAISYETAGTFDPTKRGPTTQWGQHRGLIQFGEPQAQEYGVNWDDPIGSQLGPDRAVAKYLTKAGVRPGMGMLDIYSAINAGSVGRYNASDANNGGAPGTVKDKVEGQMSGHRAKALALLGGEYQPGESDYSKGATGGGYGGKDQTAIPPGFAAVARAYREGRMTPEDAALFEQGMSEKRFPMVAPRDTKALDVYRSVAMAQPAQFSYNLGGGL